METDDVAVTEAMRHFAAIDRWERRYDGFAFHLANWDTNTAVALHKASRHPTSWRCPRIMQGFIGFGVPFGYPRSAIACLEIGCYHDVLPSALFVKDVHPELLHCLEQYTPDELAEMGELALQHRADPDYRFPASLCAGRQEVLWRIPQRRLHLPGISPLRVATISTAGIASLETYERIRTLAATLGPASMVVDVRTAPSTHSALQRLQRRKCQVPVWPRQDRAAQLLHPIGLRQTFGMKYRPVPGIKRFSRASATMSTPADTMFNPDHLWVHKPQTCAPIVELLTSHHPLLLIDDAPAYYNSLRRAITLHLLSLFSTQIEVLPEAEA